MMQLQRVASTTTVMMAMTTASTPGDEQCDNGLMGSATTFTSDTVRRFSVPNQNFNPIHGQQRPQHPHQQPKECEGRALEHQLQQPTSPVTLVRHPPQDPYHSVLPQGSTINTVINHQGTILIILFISLI